MDKNTGFVLGSRGEQATFARTLNGSQSWTGLTFPEAVFHERHQDIQETDGSTPRAVHSFLFGNPRDGWMYGPSLFETHDGGLSWRDVSLYGEVERATISGGHLWALNYRDCQQSPVDGYSGECKYQIFLLRLSLDGLRRELYPIPGRYQWGNLKTYGPNHVWLSLNASDEIDRIDTILFSSFDGGENWQRQEIDCPHNDGVFNVYPVDALRLWATCSSFAGEKVIFRSLDGGITWMKMAEALIPQEPRGDALDTVGGITGFYPASSTHAWMTVSRSRVIKTEDGGKTWEPADILYLDYDTTSLKLLDNSVWAFDRGTLIRTTDNGENWEVLLEFPDLNSERFADMAVVDENHIWMLSTGKDAPNIYASIDGGISWQCTGFPGGKDCLSVGD